MQIFIIVLLTFFAFLLLLKRQNKFQDKQTQEIKDKLTSSVQSMAGLVGSVQGSAAETIVYFKMRSEYDRLVFVPFGCDFIGINYDKGELSFVEVKSGSSRRTKEQKRLEEIVKEGNFNYKVIRVSDV